MPFPSNLNRFSVLLLCLNASLAAAQATKPAAAASAPTPAAAHKAACKIDNSVPSDAQTAYLRGEFKHSAELAAAAWTKDPADRAARRLEIVDLIDQGKVEDAAKKADEWTAVEPTDAEAIVEEGDVRFAEGDWLEAYALMVKALKLDPCVAAGYRGLARYEELAGYHAAARKNVTLAHKLAPNDEAIRRAWINSLDPKQRLAEMTKLVDASKAYDEKRRTEMRRYLESDQARLKDTCELASINGPARIPMTPIYGKKIGIASYGIEIAFNGHKRTLQIDTGASGFLLTRSVSAGLGLTKIGTGQIGGFGSEGASSAEQFHADTVRIGGLEFKDCPVDALVRLGSLGGSTDMGERLDDTDGLVGTDIFDRYLVTLDYVRHEIRLDPLPQPPNGPAPALDALGGPVDDDYRGVDRYQAPAMKDWTNIYRRGHELIMPTRINNGRTSLFIVDTGADSNIIDLKTAKEVTKAKDSLLQMRGLSGTTGNISEAGKFTADFAGLRLPVKSMDSMDLSKFDGVSGFLGYPTLSQLVMHLDYRDNLVLFEAPAGRK